MGYNMLIAQCVLTLLALPMCFAHSWSWDLVMGVDNVLTFYENGTEIHREDIDSDIEITYLSYDIAHNRILIADDGQVKDTIIYSFNIETKELEPLVKKNHEYQTITSLAIDPVEELIFWTNIDGTEIYYFDLKAGAQNNVSGNVFIQFASIPGAVAVDSCNRHIYWAEESFTRSIERSDFKGNHKQVVLNDNMSTINNLVIDQETETMYWTEGFHVQENGLRDRYTFSINSASLNGSNRKTLYIDQSGSHKSKPGSIAVTKDYVYWTPAFSNDSRMKVCRIAKDSNSFTEAEEISEFSYRFKIGIATNYKNNCPRLKDPLPNVTKLICQNYCLQGSCSVNSEGQAICSCNAGYSGTRCEVAICQGYCLNNGVCNLKEKNEPICECHGYYEGERCELPMFLAKCIKTVSMLKDILTEDVPTVKDLQPTCD